MASYLWRAKMWTLILTVLVMGLMFSPVPTVMAQPCTVHSKSFAYCKSLNALGSSLAWNLFSQNSTLEIAFTGNGFITTPQFIFWFYLDDESFPVQLLFVEKIWTEGTWPQLSCKSLHFVQTKLELNHSIGIIVAHQEAPQRTRLYISMKPSLLQLQFEHSCYNFSLNHVAWIMNCSVKVLPFVVSVSQT